MNKSKNTRVGELAENQQGESDARANTERATYTDGQKERGMEEWEGRRRRGASKNKGSAIADEEAEKRRWKEAGEWKWRGEKNGRETTTCNISAVVTCRWLTALNQPESLNFMKQHFRRVKGIHIFPCNLFLRSRFFLKTGNEKLYITTDFKSPIFYPRVSV